MQDFDVARHVKRLFGEIDFVVLIPSEGVFCLEVKSGSVARREGVWYFTNRFGERDSSPVGPFNQARDGMYSLLEEIRRRCGNSHRFNRLAFGYGVCFPHIPYPTEDVESDAWRVYDRDSRRLPISAYLHELARRTHEHIKSQKWYDPVASRPTDADVAQLVGILRGDFERVASPHDLDADVEVTLWALTREQYDALDAAELNPRCVFEGGAGTGKTFLAREYARRAAAEGLRTLLVCFNKLLGLWLQQQNTAERLTPTVMTGSFHALLDDLIAASSHRAEFRRIQAEQPDNLFTVQYPFHALLALEEGAAEPFDVLVVDEGQDLIRPEYLDVLDALVRGGLAGGQWTFFCDFHRQALYQREPAEKLLAQLQQRAPHIARQRLKTNCRNTRPIGEETSLVSGFETPPFLFAEVAGRPVDYRFAGDTAQQRQQVEEIVTGLLGDGVPPNRITLLSPVQRENSCLAGLTSLAGCPLRDLEGPPAGRGRALGHTTIQAFKGLENTAIILHDITRLADDASRSVLYVGMSRARQRLAVVLGTSCRPEYEAAVRQNLLRSTPR